MKNLRIRLFEITDNGIPGTHSKLIQQLRSEIPHAVQMQESPTAIERYTCVMHAFDLVENSKYIDIVDAAPAYVFASLDFLQGLIVHEQLRPRDYSEKGALIVYCENNCAKHIGTMVASDRVESKWGTGHLYEHDIWEVPAQYGTEIRYFEPIDSENALDAFIGYAKGHGVYIEEND